MPGRISGFVFQNAYKLQPWIFIACNEGLLDSESKRIPIDCYLLYLASHQKIRNNSQGGYGSACSI